jgi:hypothetical protein
MKGIASALGLTLSQLTEHIEALERGDLEDSSDRVRAPRHRSGP